MVTLLYFAKLREMVGTSEQRLELPEGIETVSQLADWLAERHPAFADRVRLRVAVDRVMADFATDVRDAKEVAFFPPVTGG